MKPTLGRIVLVRLVQDGDRWMPGIVVEVDDNNDRFIRVKVFHPDGAEFDPMWLWEETDEEAAHPGSYRANCWKWPPRG